MTLISEMALRRTTIAKEALRQLGGIVEMLMEGGNWDVGGVAYHACSANKASATINELSWREIGQNRFWYLALRHLFIPLIAIVYALVISTIPVVAQSELSLGYRIANAIRYEAVLQCDSDIADRNESPLGERKRLPVNFICINGGPSLLLSFLECLEGNKAGTNGADQSDGRDPILPSPIFTFFSLMAFLIGIPILWFAEKHESRCYDAIGMIGMCLIVFGAGLFFGSAVLLWPHF